MEFTSDGSRANVQSIHDTQVVDGRNDVIIIPEGTFSWGADVKVTKNCIIRGASEVNADTGVCNDLTTLVDDITDPGGNTGFFDCTITGDKFFRLSGLTFTKGGRDTNQFNGMIRVHGQSKNVRIDHLHFTGQLRQTNGIAIYSGIRGVADHIVEDSIFGQNLQNRVFNGTAPYGDLEWSQPAGYGTDDFFFFEDWFVNNDGKPFSAGGGWDASTAGKYVVRHCKLWDVEILCHGTESARERGGRAYEVYNVEYHFSYSTDLDGIRSGSMILHDNTFFGVKPAGWNTQAYRQIFGYTGGPWKGSTGFNDWDYNATAANLSHTPGQPGYVFDTGTVTAFTQGNPMIVTDSTKNWTPNQWVNYVISCPATGDTWRITANTATTISGLHWGDPNDHQAFTVGQTYRIGYVIQLLDQPCSGASSLPESTVGPTPVWLNQQKEPCYAWNNIHPATSGSVGIKTASPGLLVEGRDFFNGIQLPGYTPFTYPHPLVTANVGGEVNTGPIADPPGSEQEFPVDVELDAQTGGGWTLQAADGFDGANNADLTTSGVWTARSGKFVYNAGLSAAANAGASVLNLYVFTGVVFDSNQFVRAKLAHLDSAVPNIGIAARIQPGALSAYVLAYDTGKVSLYRFDNGTFHNLFGVNRSYVGGEDLRLEVTGAGSGTRLTAYEDTGGGSVPIPELSGFDPGVYYDGGATGLYGFSGIGGMLLADWSAGSFGLPVQIFYTLDGSDPSPTNGTLIDGPSGIVTLFAPATLKSVSVQGGVQSDIATEVYTGAGVETFVKDPATAVAEAIVEVLDAQEMLAGYLFAPWDSDREIEQPNAYVKVVFEAAIVEPEMLDHFQVEVTFEGKPKQGNPAYMLAEALGLIRRADFALLVQDEITDGSVTFNSKAEAVRLAQQVVGDLRRRVISFSLFGRWNVQHV